jgi:hypothetical protein
MEEEGEAEKRGKAGKELKERERSRGKKKQMGQREVGKRGEKSVKEGDIKKGMQE